MDDLGNACSGFDQGEIDELRDIVTLYREAGGLVIKLASWAGDRAEGLLARAPAEWQSKITEVTDLALRDSYRMAFATQADEASTSWLNAALAWAEGETWHKAAASITGAIGGFGGIATTLVDLPVTTTLILRSIQQIAKEYEEDTTDETVRAQCLSIFGFGGPLVDDDQAETGLFTARVAFTGATVAEALKAVLPRFGVVVSQKLLAQATPVLGAVTGGTINNVFVGYYQTMAHVHFRLRKLERTHDRNQVKACFERIYRSAKLKNSPGGPG